MAECIKRSRDDDSHLKQQFDSLYRRDCSFGNSRCDPTGHEVFSKRKSSIGHDDNAKITLSVL